MSIFAPMETMQKLQEELKAELFGNILPFWADRMADPCGGFYGRMNGDGGIVPDSPKGGILNARILWTFAAAYRASGRQEYLQTALKAKREVIGHFYDAEYGGTYWSLDSEGRPLDTKKQIYSIAFTVYALAELYRACGDDEALEYAVALYLSIESHSFDRERNGYLEAFSRDWGPLEDVRLSDKDQNDAKTMNTHLHVLEAYTALYRVWPDSELGGQLKNLIELFLDRIAGSDAHLRLFFDEDWNCTSHTVSYGHDIECSWLLAEAAEVLGDETVLKRTLPLCSRMAAAALEGWSPEGGMIYETSLPGPDNCDSGKGSDVWQDADRHWWVQAETVVGCLWQYRYSGEAIWLERAETEWKFIREHLICPDGEWYWSLRADGSVNTEDDRAGFWKCPYHNGRMCIEALLWKKM